MSVGRIWAKGLGLKQGRSDREAHIVVLVRTMIVACYIVTNAVIVAGVARHWYD